jgi:SSS family solute:Na+ symporter
MNAIDFAIVAAYLAGMIGVGALASRRIHGFRDYFVAGGQMTASLLVCTLVSTYYGLDVLFGGSEVSFLEGVVAFFGYTRPYYVTILIAAFVIARKLKHYDFLSLPDVAAHFYGNGTRAVVAIASAFYALPLLSIMGIGILLDLVVGIPFVWGVLLGATVSVVYTIMGGLLADALTDTLQFVLMCVTLGIAAVLTLRTTGGVDGLQAALPASFFDPTGTYPAWVLLVFAGSALSALIEPAFYQRIFAAVDYRAVVVALVIGIVLWAAYDWVTTILGMAAAARGIDAEPRYALLALVLEVLPAGLRGLFVAGVLATAMSTIDSYLLIAGGNLAYDLYRPLFRPEMDEQRVLRLARWMILVSAAASVALALFFRSVVSAWIFMSTVLVAAALVPLLAALYAPWRPTPAAGLASSLAGLGVAVGYFALVSVFGSYDEEWATKIWTVELGGRSFELWQEYALLFALPASAAGYLLGRLGSRAAPEPAPEAAAGAHPLTPSGP